MLRIAQQQQKDTDKPDHDRDQKAPAEALLAKNEDLERDGDERQRCLEHGGEARRHVLFCPEHRAIRDHEHQRTNRQQTAPLFAGGTRTSTKTHHGVEQGAG